MTAIPTNRTTANSPSEHVSDHNILHHFNNEHPTDPSAHIGTYVALVAAPGGVDDTALVQAAINAANAAHGGMLQFSVGTYVCTTLTLYRGVHLVGAGVGGDVFSNTDVLLPFGGTVIKLKSGTNADLVKTENFDSLTGLSSPSNYDTPERFSLRHIVLDGNNQGNSSGWPLRIFARNYTVDGLVVQNGASGGVYSEYGLGGYDEVPQWSNFDIVRCNGVSLDWRGPHDGMFVNGKVSAPSGTPSPTHGIKLSGYVGGEQFTNVHAWGNFSVTPWELGGSLAQCINCYSDGGGIVILGNGNTWDGLILGTNTPGQVAVKLGDTATRSIGQNHVRGRVYQFKASPYVAITPTTTSTGNRFDAVANMGAVLRYQAKGNVYTTTSSTAAGAATIAMSATTDLPASGTLYADDGTNRTTTLAYTGKTSNSLTGVTGVPGGGLASGAALWVADGTPLNTDSFEVWDYDQAGTGSGLILRRPTPFGQSSHTALDTFTGKFYAQEGIQLAGPSGVAGGLLTGGIGAPTASGTAGDIYIRSDTPSTSTQRIYFCTGTTTWIDALGISEAQVASLVTDLAAKAPLAGPTFTGITTAPEFSASGLTGATAASRYVGATTAGAPTTGTFAVGDFVIDQGGTLWICTTAGSPGSWSTTKPVDPLAKALGYINWNYNNAAAGSGSVLTSQRADVAALWLPPGTVVSNALLTVVTAGTSTAPTGFFVGLATATKMLTQSSNLNASANLTSVGTKAFAVTPYTTSLADSPSGLYYVVVLQNGAFAGTNVAFLRANGSTPGYAPGGGFTFGNIGTGLTALPANAAATVIGAAGLGWNVGVS